MPIRSSAISSCVSEKVWVLSWPNHKHVRIKIITHDLMYLKIYIMSSLSQCVSQEACSEWQAKATPPGTGGRSDPSVSWLHPQIQGHYIEHACLPCWKMKFQPPSHTVTRYVQYPVIAAHHTSDDRDVPTSVSAAADVDGATTEDAFILLCFLSGLQGISKQNTRSSFGPNCRVISKTHFPPWVDWNSVSRPRGTA